MVTADADIEMGIPADERLAVAQGLSRLLADTYTLYLKTHNYHWNVTGPMFSSLHLMFETEYMELALAVDEIAERVRALGVRAPASYREFSTLATISEDTDTPDAQAMIRRLEQDQETVVRIAREVFPVAESARDQSTLDLLTRRMQIHEKNAWMLRSLLQ
ncbi:MAG: Dps family protein [Candidatus Dormibacteria bacterium]|jgi:starvation-inducible DNA-binding protein